MLAGAALAAAGCAPAGEAEAFDGGDVVLLTLDTTRADHLGCYGYFRDTSPRLDELAEEAVLFERCLVPMATTTASWTSPSHSSSTRLPFAISGAGGKAGGRPFWPLPLP